MVALVHGGPGAAGEMEPVARRLSGTWDVREPQQSAMSVEGQVLELREAIDRPAAVLVGFSWGAWLSVIVAARFPKIVHELVLISCPTFDVSELTMLHERRAARLTPEEAAEYRHIVAEGGSLERLGRLAFKADHFDADAPVGVAANQAIYDAVWPEAARMRASGELSRMLAAVTCPIVSITGEHDPSPPADLPNRIVLERCGHTPWLERQARDRFYEVLINVLTAASRPRACM